MGFVKSVQGAGRLLNSTILWGQQSPLPAGRCGVKWMFKRASLGWQPHCNCSCEHVFAGVWWCVVCWGAWCAGHVFDLIRITVAPLNVYVHQACLITTMSATSHQLSTPLPGDSQPPTASSSWFLMVPQVYTRAGLILICTLTFCYLSLPPPPTPHPAWGWQDTPLFLMSHMM